MTRHILSVFHEMQGFVLDMDTWKNIPLTEEVLSIFEMAVAKGTEDISEEDRIGFCTAVIEDDMLPVRDVPRLALRVLAFIPEGRLDDVRRDLKDYVDVDGISDEQYAQRHGRLLKFDHIERTERWEKIIYDVEKKCSEMLKDEPRCMGFCFSYWSAKSAVLGDMGISWDSPSIMNPHVLFD